MGLSVPPGEVEELNRTDREHSGCVWSVAFNASGTRLASGGGYYQGGSGQAKVWDVITGMELLTLADDKDSVYCVAFTADARRLATANKNGLIRIWEGGPFLMDIPKFEPLPRG